jgi:AcrR family transcriptional regulator
MKRDYRIDQIKKKTLNLIALNGSMDSIRTKDIANAIGASEATMFKYFDSKADIIESVIKDYVQSRPLNFPTEEITELGEFKEALHKILDFTFDSSVHRNRNVSLIVQVSLKKHPVSRWNYKNLQDEVWSFIENRIEYGKQHWEFDRSVDSGIQARLFYYAPLMFYIQMELFGGKTIEQFDYDKVKKTHIINFLKILTEGNNQ